MTSADTPGSTRPDPADLTWERPGGDPGDGGDAVEIAPLPDGGHAMRNAADGPDGAVLYFTRGEWDAFVLGVRDGEFDVG
jgi:hypothetical protein